MAKEIPSVGHLRRKSEVSDDEIAAAAAAGLNDEDSEPFAFESGHTINVAKAIEMHPPAKKLLADKATTPGLRRTMVMTAVIIGFPVQEWAKKPTPSTKPLPHFGPRFQSEIML